jgi:hypothetical protein
VIGARGRGDRWRFQGRGGCLGCRQYKVSNAMGMALDGNKKIVSQMRSARVSQITLLSSGTIPG